MNRIKSNLFAAACLLPLTACGLNSVRVETAGQVAKLSDSVSTLATGIIDDAQARRDRSLISLVASDASCELTFPILIYAPNGLEAPEPNVAVPLCADGAGAKAHQGYSIEKLDFNPLTTEAIRPTIDLIAATAAYGEALSKIVDRPKADVAKELDSVLSLAGKAHAQATALGIKGLPSLDILSEDQKKTATDLIQMVVDLEHERRQVKDIKLLYPKYAEKLGRFCSETDLTDDPKCKNSGIYSNLGSQIANWSVVVSTGQAQINIINLQRAYRNERNGLSFEGRVAFLSLVQDAAKEPGRVQSAKKVFEEALGALSSANVVLGRQLFNPNKDDRQKAAKIAQERILNALSLVLKAVMAWKGI
jgi:hypothetical protein